MPHHNESMGSSHFDFLQRWFQAVIENPGGIIEGIESPEAQRWMPLDPDKLEGVIQPSKSLGAHARLSIYSNAYFARLVECLGESFPVLRRAVGKDVFASFAVEYLQRYPSRSYSLDHLGDHFSRFLNETRPDRTEDGSPPPKIDWPDFLIDLATLEWTIAQIFDGPGVEGQRILTPADLRDARVDCFERARLKPVSCLRLLEFRYPVNDYYTAARQARDDDEIPLPEPSHEALAITRRDYTVRRYRLTPVQKVLLEELLGHRSIGEAIAAAAKASAMDDDALAGEIESCFCFWASERFFESIELGKG